MSNDDAPQVPQLIGSAEVCARLGISRSTLQLRIQLREIQPAGKMPGKSGAYLFDPHYIDGLAADSDSADQQQPDVPTAQPHACGSHCAAVPYDARNIS